MDSSKDWKIALSKVELGVPGCVVWHEEALESIELQAGLDWKVKKVLIEIEEVVWLPRRLLELRSRCEARCSRSGRYLKRCWVRP